MLGRDESPPQTPDEGTVSALESTHNRTHTNRGLIAGLVTLAVALGAVLFTAFAGWVFRPLFGARPDRAA